MKDADAREIEIKLRTIEQLFVAPDQDMFSELEVELCGESATERLQKKLQPGFWKKSGHLRLVIKLPEDQIEPGLDQKVINAINRLVEIRTKDNEMAIRSERWNGVRGLVMALVIAVILLGIGALLGNTILANYPESGYLIYALISLTIWVIIWNPLDSLIFSWIPYSRANQILAYMSKAEIVIKPWD